MRTAAATSSLGRSEPLSCSSFSALVCQFDEHFTNLVNKLSLSPNFKKHKGFLQIFSNGHVQSGLKAHSWNVEIGLGGVVQGWYPTAFWLEASNAAGLWKEWVLGKACLPSWLALSLASWCHPEWRSKSPNRKLFRSPCLPPACCHISRVSLLYYLTLYSAAIL